MITRKDTYIVFHSAGNLKEIDECVTYDEALDCAKGMVDENGGEAVIAMVISVVSEARTTG